MAVYLSSVADYLRENFSWKYAAIGGTAVGILMLKRYMGGATSPSKARMSGKTVIITGANCGIGKATAVELARHGARVILACRDTQAGETAVRNIRRSTTGGELLVRHLDLASLQSVRAFCSQILDTEPRLDVLINNAGVYQCPFSHTEDGFEQQFGVNHLGHFLLTNLLLDRMKVCAPSRVVVVSSGLYKLGNMNFDNLNGELDYKVNRAYYNSKLANCLFARELARRVKNSGVSVHCLRPGMVRTNLGRHVHWNPVLKALVWLPAWVLIKGPRQGCQTVVYCSVAEELEGVSGKFYGNCAEEPWTGPALDIAAAARLWEVSAALTKL